jgi:hypothetical protein
MRRDGMMVEGRCRSRRSSQQQELRLLPRHLKPLCKEGLNSRVVLVL